jgi:prepilin-type N-terminal cleavage/methylation domain-containing protein
MSLVRRTRPSNSRRSFTLIELLVVIAIIGLLAGVAVASLNNARVRARDAKRVGDISQITKAIELAFAFNGSYPIPTGNTLLPAFLLVLPQIGALI